MSVKSQRTWGKVVEFAIPLIVLLLLGYGSWVYGYYVCWGEVRKHHSSSTATGLVIGEVLLIVVIYITWFQILWLGPGRQPKIPLYRLRPDPEEKVKEYRSIDPPQVFSCDVQGYPLWCTNCQSIKAERTHHSSRMGYCVPKFDHYCTWLGAVIGRRNYRLFVQFCVWFTLLFFYVLVSTAVYTRDMVKHTGTLNANVIVLYILSAFWFFMVYAMSGQHLYYVWFNKVSIDDIEQRNSKRNGTVVDKYYSVTQGDTRYTIRVNPFNERVYDKGFAANWTETMGSNPAAWLLPLGAGVTEPPFESENHTYESILGDYAEHQSPKWLSTATERISTGDFLHKEPLPERARTTKI